MATKTEKNVQLKINKMTKNIFDQLSVQGLISEDELYLLSDDETGSATWGTIGGELSNQTDLKIMLDSKAGQEQVNEIEAKIPSAATSENQLADKAFVNSSINNYAANYTPLSTFNETLGDLSSIIHGI